MSVLILMLPARARLADAPVGVEWSWALSADGIGVASQGRGTPSTWPRADGVVAVLADADVAWHRITLPKAPPSRLQQALQGVLEERLLDDEAVHFALPPDAAPGRQTWVAVTHRGWLQATLARLEAGQRNVDRVVPGALPGAPAQGHFTRGALAGAADADDALQLALSDADGAAVFGLDGTLARNRVAAALARTDGGPRWTATPSAAAAAEAWLGQPVAVLSEAERALQSLRSGWNLRQFGLQPKHRGAAALREACRRFLGPAWRPVRIGLAALLVVQLVGLNAWAWQERRALDAKRAAMVDLLKTTHPQVTVVLDAPLQMARETAALRAAAGQPGETDLETLLAAAAAGWPDDEVPVASLRFEPGRLTLGVPDWQDDDAAALRERLHGGGWTVTLADQLLTLARVPGATP